MCSPPLNEHGEGETLANANSNVSNWHYDTGADPPNAPDLADDDDAVDAVSASP